jgi:ankyrin repeat protein
VRHNRLKIFQNLLTKGANILVATNDTRETPLHFACHDVGSEFTLSILGNQACTSDYINAFDKYGDTALFNACRSKNTEIIRSLILHPGCNRSVINGITKEMPVHVACRMNLLDVLKVLTTEGADSPMQCDQLNHLDQSVLHLACENDAEDIVDYLIDNKICEQNNFDCYGRTPLHIACMRGNTNIVKKLITSERFQITDKDKKENTVLHYICSRDIVDPELIKLCLDSANSLLMVIEQNSSKYNPLHYLCAGDRAQVLHYLLKHSSDHESFNIALVAPGGDDNDTPLHLATKEARKFVHYEIYF